MCSLFAAWFPGGATVSQPYRRSGQNRLCPLLTSAARSAHLSAALSSVRGHAAALPGYSRLPSTRDRQIYVARPCGWIEDFALWCRLVPQTLPRLVSAWRRLARPCDAIPVRRPASSPSAFFRETLPPHPLPSASLRLHQAGGGLVLETALATSYTHLQTAGHTRHTQSRAADWVHAAASRRPAPNG